MFFQIKEESTEARTEDFATRYSQRIEMSFNVTKISRSVYNIFALIAEVGGLYGLFLVLAAGIANFFNF